MGHHKFLLRVVESGSHSPMSLHLCKLLARSLRLRSLGLGHCLDSFGSLGSERGHVVKTWGAALFGKALLCLNGNLFSWSQSLCSLGCEGLLQSIVVAVGIASLVVVGQGRLGG